MSKKGQFLGEFEECVLLALEKLGDDAYGVTIVKCLEHAGRNVSFGAVYKTLNRIEEKNLASSSVGEATAVRGGRPKRYFKITKQGISALREAEKYRQSLRNPILNQSPGGIPVIVCEANP